MLIHWYWKIHPKIDAFTCHLPAGCLPKKRKTLQGRLYRIHNWPPHRNWTQQNYQKKGKSQCPEGLRAAYSSFTHTFWCSRKWIGGRVIYWNDKSRGPNGRRRLEVFLIVSQPVDQSVSFMRGGLFCICVESINLTWLETTPSVPSEEEAQANGLWNPNP